MQFQSITTAGAALLAAAVLATAGLTNVSGRGGRGQLAQVPRPPGRCGRE